MKIEMEMDRMNSRIVCIPAFRDIDISRLLHRILLLEIRIDVKRNRVFHSIVYNFVGRQI